MLMSSMMGAIAFQKDLGAVHSCAHALSTVADLHHGLANGMMIDHVMRFNLPAATAKMAELAHVAGVPAPAASPTRPRRGVHRLAGDAEGATSASRRRCPRSTARAGDARRHSARWSTSPINDICHQTNPRPCTRADFERIFAEAL